jgi:mannosyl-3-phosphoglycerate phosphatase
LSNEKPKLVVFADLDGALLDDDYGYESAKPIINKLLSMDVSIIFCSSKTQGEIEHYRQKMDVQDPFIVENGGAIIVPKNYFPFIPACSKHTEKYDIVDLGVPYAVVREKLARIKLETEAGIVGFGDLTAEEVAAETGLPLNMARLAKKRKYDEPCRILWGNEKTILATVEKEGLVFVKGGRYFHLLGGTDKGKATAALKDLYVKAFGRTVTFGVGDSPVDLPMLEAVDMPLLVRNSSGGKNAHLVVWRNVLRLVTQKARGESAFSVLAEQQSTLNCQTRTSPEAGPES